MIRDGRFFLTLALGLCLAAACKPTAKPNPALRARRSIDSLEKATLAAMDASSKAPANPVSPGGPDESELERTLTLVKEYQLFAADFPHDSATPGYLLKEGQIFYTYLRDFEQAERVFTHLSDSFPKAAERPGALFFLANARHDRGDTAGAQATIRRLQAEYPGSNASQMGAQLSEYIRRGKPAM